MSAALPLIVFGGGAFISGTVDEAKVWLDLLPNLGIKQIDTARIYGESEATLGKLDAPKKFIIDTKVPGGFGGQKGMQTKEGVLSAWKTSSELLKVDSVETYYLHAPDPATPLEETLSAINDLHKQGKFKNFGLSNFNPEQVQQVYDIAKKNNYVLPTVYQGNYNPVSRHIEKDLFPLLRKLGIRFYVYSAIAGGFLAKSVDQIKAGGQGRWDPNNFLGKLYHGLYNRPKILQGLQEWGRISDDSGISRSELAYRFIAFHSALKAELGDAIIVGASRPEQLEQTVEGLKRGPLPKEVVERIEGVWELVKDDAPVNNFSG